MNKGPLKHLVHLWLPPVLWMALIFYFSSQAQTSLPDFGAFEFSIKKLAHVTVYVVLYLLLFRTLRGIRGYRLAGLGIYVLPAIVAILYGISDEIHQTFVAGRNGTFSDVLIDCVGVLGGYLLARRYLKRSCERWSR
jgi:VanZ family protein